MPYLCLFLILKQGKKNNNFYRYATIATQPLKARPLRSMRTTLNGGKPFSEGAPLSKKAKYLAALISGIGPRHSRAEGKFLSYLRTRARAQKL